MSVLELKSSPINILLMSDGGSAMSALAFYDRIKSSPNETKITATGLVASAAVIILAAGTVRRMTPNAWVMVHDDTPSPDDTKRKRVSELKRTVRLSNRFENQWNALMAVNSKTAVSDWKKLHDEETYLDAKECLTLGLIHGIVGVK